MIVYRAWSRMCFARKPAQLAVVHGLLNGARVVAPQRGPGLSRAEAVVLTILGDVPHAARVDAVVLDRAAEVLEELHALGELRDAQAERRADTEGRGGDGERVVEVADQAERVVANERVEARADRHGHAPAEGDHTHEQRQQDVGHPAVDAPVVDGHEDGLLRALCVVVDVRFVRD